jgi:hypothetical protein
MLKSSVMLKRGVTLKRGRYECEPCGRRGPLTRDAFQNTRAGEPNRIDWQPARASYLAGFMRNNAARLRSKDMARLVYRPPALSAIPCPASESPYSRGAFLAF